jgi:PHD/YefM family antitoxin component YafN of YafNO toxin-antitoxin module
MTGAEFNRAPSAVKQHVLDSAEPVVVTERTKPVLVVMGYDDYVHLTSRPIITDLAEWLRLDEDIDFEPEPWRVGLRVPEL